MAAYFFFFCFISTDSEFSNICFSLCFVHFMHFSHFKAIFTKYFFNLYFHFYTLYKFGTLNQFQTFWISKLFWIFRYFSICFFIYVMALGEEEQLFISKLRFFFQHFCLILHFWKFPHFHIYLYNYYQFYNCYYLFFLLRIAFMTSSTGLNFRMSLEDLKTVDDISICFPLSGMFLREGLI